MHSRFVKTSNVSRFLAAVSTLEDRGAPEASFMLVAGDAGHGKSRTGQWWATHHDAAFVRIKAAATPHWLMTDLMRELGRTAPAHSCEKLFGQIVGSLVREPRALVIDEIESAMHDMRVIETLRDISDITEVPVVLIGREYVQGHLRKYPQLWSRVSAVTLFAPVSLDDVTLLAGELCEVALDDGVIKKVHGESEGRVREVIKALANVERIGKRSAAGEVTLAEVEHIRLTQEFQATRRRRPGALTSEAA